MGDYRQKFGFVTGFIGHSQLATTGKNNSPWTCTIYNSLWRELSLLSVLRLLQVLW
jgi:hypothetical protein